MPSKPYPHPEERPKGASRRTQGRYAALRLNSCPASGLITLSECYAYTPVDGQRRSQHFGTVIGQHDRQPDIADRLRVEVGSEQRVAAVEKIVDETKELHLPGHLIGSVQVDQPIAGELLVLIGVVAHEVPAADGGRVQAEGPIRCRHDVEPEFSLVERDAGYPLSRRHMDVAVAVCHGVIRRREVAGELVGRVDQAVAGVDEPLRRLILDARFQSLAAGARHVLKKAPALNRAARDIYNVVAAV